MKCRALVAATLSICPVISVAAQAPPAIDSDFALTVYSTADPATFDPQELARQKLANPYNAWQFKLPGYGVVRETRKIDLVAGDNTLRFENVAAGIDPKAVSFKSRTAPDTTAVLEQNYEYDVVNASKLLDKYLGKDVQLTRKAGDSLTRNEQLSGRLLSADFNSLVLQTKDGNVIVMMRGEVTTITLAKDESNLITKPTLVWKLSADQAGKHDALVTYQTDGLTWRADYNIIVNDKDTAADIGAWVTLLNESGASYPNAKLKLVAGDVQRVKPPQEMYQGQAYDSSRLMNKAAATGFAEKSFFEYHLYTLGRPTSLSDNSTKQIELFPQHSNVPVNKTYVYYGLPENLRYWFSPEPNQDRNLGTQSNKKVDIYLLMQNSEKNGMGMPLPAGRIRVYKKDDADAALEFVGEDVIQHTPKDEQVMVRLGSAFDVVGERKQTDFNANYDQHWITESFEIKLRNHKKEAAHIIVKENLFRWTNWEITKSSDKWEKQDYRTIHIPIDVAPDGEKTVTYSVKYTW